MKKAVKKRVGRPPGRRAPHRPVLSARVPAEDYAMVSKAAEASGRTVSEEAVWRIRQSFEWEKAFGETRAVLAEANETASKVAKASLEGELRRQGYIRHWGINGSAWFEPGVNTIQWIFGSFGPDTRALLEEMLERAATRAVEKVRIGS
jgi:hypothetical protein